MNKPNTILQILNDIKQQITLKTNHSNLANNIKSGINSLIVRFQKVWYADGFRVRKGVESLFGMVICCSGMLSAYRRDKFERVMDSGWLDETFLGCAVRAGDDRRMTNLMLQLGGRSVFQSTAVAYTFVPHNATKFF